jgi:hypothetical protein
MKSIKAQAKERDRFRCLACGSTKNLTIDHILPRANGGANVLENYQTMCQPCNSIKNDTYVDFLVMSQVQKRLWLLEQFGPDWREILEEKNGKDAYDHSQVRPRGRTPEYWIDPSKCRPGRKHRGPWKKLRYGHNKHRCENCGYITGT